MGRGGRQVQVGEADGIFVVVVHRAPGYDEADFSRGHLIAFGFEFCHLFFAGLRQDGHTFVLHGVEESVGVAQWVAAAQFHDNALVVFEIVEVNIAVGEGDGNRYAGGGFDVMADGCGHIAERLG